MKIYIAEGMGYEGAAVYGLFSMRADAIAYLEDSITKEKDRGAGFTNFDQYTVCEVELNRGVPNNATHDVVFDMKEYNDAILEQYLREEGLE